jgi:hypothetical protein
MIPHGARHLAEAAHAVRVVEGIRGKVRAMPVRFSFSPSKPEKSRKSGSPAPIVERCLKTPGFEVCPLTIEAGFHYPVAQSPRSAGLQAVLVIRPSSFRY